MYQKVKKTIKRILSSAGLYNESGGIKISQEAKAAIILNHQTPELRILVETGTRHGDMLNVLKDRFDLLYSIELDAELFEKGKERFKDHSNIFLFQGDSGIEINNVLKLITEPAIFWLDAHGDTVEVTGQNSAPIKKELEAVFSHPVNGHVILIDDARHIDNKGISILKKMSESNKRKFIAKDGVIRIYEK